nr:hypothetical protein Q903MT_gene2920 [Picea sitchensis]
MQVGSNQFPFMVLIPKSMHPNHIYMSFFKGMKESPRIR